MKNQMLWPLFKIFSSNSFYFGMFLENFKKGIKGILKNLLYIALIIYFVVVAGGLLPDNVDAEDLECVDIVIYAFPVCGNTILQEFFLDLGHVEHVVFIGLFDKDTTEIIELEFLIRSLRHDALLPFDLIQIIVPNQGGIE